MSTTVIDMNNFRRIFVERESIEQRASSAVADKVAHRVTSMILAQACARAARLVNTGVKFDDAVRRAVAWAMYANEPESA